MVFQIHFFTALRQQRCLLLRALRRDHLNLLRMLLVLPVVIVLCSCMIKRSSYDVPVYQLPGQFKNQQVAETPPDNASAADGPAAETTGDTATESAIGGTVESGAEPVPKLSDFVVNEWWQSFGSQELSSLIDRGMANNPDVRIATLHISQAKVRADLARTGEFPTLDSTVAAGPQKGNSPSAALSGVGLTLAWQLDMWGEKSSLLQEANFQLWQAVFEANNTKRNVAAAIANSYIEYLLSNDRLKISRETEKILIGLLATIEKRAAVGDATLLELEQQRSAIYSELALIPNLEQQREDAIESIAYLLGTVPSQMKLSDADMDSLHLPTSIPDLPSSLLLRRPDVRAVEARLLAADVDIDVMRARVLPNVSLTAAAGYSGLLSQLIKPQSFFWNSFANVATNIFDAGKLTSNVRQSELIHEEMIETYSRTILQAVREVERSLYSVKVSGQRAKLENGAMTFAQKAWDISNKMYAVGGVDFMALQDTQRTYRRYMEDYQQIRSDYFHSYVALFQALGGGEDTDDTLPGKGIRPTAANPVMGGASGSAGLAGQFDQRDTKKSHIQWQSNPDDLSRKPEYWQVVLPGHYQKKTIDAVLRDLQTRFPQQMENRDLYPVLLGRLGDSKEGEVSWYRLFVAQFATADGAREFCQLLRTDMQRCQVTTNHSREFLADAAGAGQPANQAGGTASRRTPIAQTEPPVPLSVIAPTAVRPEAASITIAAAPESLPLQPPSPEKESPKPGTAIAPIALTPSAPAAVAQSGTGTGTSALSMPNKLQIEDVGAKDQGTAANLVTAPVAIVEDTSIPLYWKVELTERYPRSKIARVLHDLQGHFPTQMKFKSITINRDDNLGQSDRLSWYRVQIKQFETARLAWEFCQMLRTDSGASGQVCQVVSSRSEQALTEESVNGAK